MKTVGDVIARINSVATRLDEAQQHTQKQINATTGRIQEAGRAPGALFEDEVRNLTGIKQRYLDLDQAQDKLCRARDVLQRIAVDDQSRGELILLLNAIDGLVDSIPPSTPGR